MLLLVQGERADLGQDANKAPAGSARTDALEARETVERLSTPLHLGVKKLRDIIEDHRARGRRVHVARSMGNVRIENTFASANDKDFAEVLEWGRPA